MRKELDELQEWLTLKKYGDQLLYVNITTRRIAGPCDDQNPCSMAGGGGPGSSSDSRVAVLSFFSHMYTKSAHAAAINTLRLEAGVTATA